MGRYDRPFVRPHACSPQPLSGFEPILERSFSELVEPEISISFQNTSS